jgi:hypothetical protein
VWGAIGGKTDGPPLENSKARTHAIRHPLYWTTGADPAGLRKDAEGDSPNKER